MIWKTLDVLSKGMHKKAGRKKIFNSCIRDLGFGTTGNVLPVFHTILNRARSQSSISICIFSGTQHTRYWASLHLKEKAKENSREHTAATDKDFVKIFCSMGGNKQTSKKNSGNVYLKIEEAYSSITAFFGIKYFSIFKNNFHSKTNLNWQQYLGTVACNWTMFSFKICFSKTVPIIIINTKCILLLNNRPYMSGLRCQ